MSRRSLRCDMVFTMLSALHHGQGAEGNESLFRRQRMVVRGDVMDLPVVSGNSLKHTMVRAPGVQHMLRVLEIPEQSLSRSVIHLLFSGGSLSKTGSTIDIKGYRKLQELIPILGICGGAVGNTMVQSSISVGDAYPVCEENEERIPFERLSQAGVISAETGLRLLATPSGHLTDRQMSTRHDPLRAQDVSRYLTSGDIECYDSTKVAGKRAREAGQTPEKGDSQQMIFYRETLVAGTVLHSTWYTNQLTEVQEASLWSALHEWLRRPFLAAGSGVGMGHCRLKVVASEPIALRYPEWDRALAVAGDNPDSAAARTMQSEYEDVLRKNRADILSVLGDMA